MARLSNGPPPAQIDLADRHSRPRPSALGRAWSTPDPADPTSSKRSCRSRPGTARRPLGRIAGAAPGADGVLLHAELAVRALEPDAAGTVAPTGW
jgi:hypothetical protein